MSVTYPQPCPLVMGTTSQTRGNDIVQERGEAVGSAHMHGLDEPRLRTMRVERVLL